MKSVGMTAHHVDLEWRQWGGALKTHARVTAALVRREMRAHFGESRLGYLWALIEPALHLGGFLLVFTYLIHRNVPLGNSTALFLLTGIVPYFLYRKIANYISGSVGSNRALLILPPVKVVDVIVARVILESTTYLFVGFLMFVGLYLGGVTDAVPDDPVRLVDVCALAVGFGLGIGLINIVIQSFLHSWMFFFNMLSFPLWIFSGIWFLPEQVPQPFREYVLYNPLTHVVLMFRSCFYGNYKPIYLDISYIVEVTGVAVLLGLALMQVARRRVLDPL
jgi:capsular polysaccharide transport system permease protein